MTTQWPFTIACQICPLMQFQPSATQSHYFTKSGCHKTYTECPSPQTMPVQIGNETSDFLCKCSSWQGYRPVPMAKHDCKVFESSSDCVCRLDPCPDGQVLNSTGMYVGRSDFGGLVLYFLTLINIKINRVPCV